MIFKYSSYGKIILLNKENMRWVRMSSDLYQHKIENMGKFWKELNDEFDFFEKKVKKCEVKSLHIITTKKCNMKCAFCAMNSGPDVNVEDEFTVAELKSKAIKIVHELKPSLSKVIISGGEPFVKEGIEEFVAEIAKLVGKDKILFQTNGLLLDKRRIDFLINNVGVVELSIENIFQNIKEYKKLLRVLDDLHSKHARLSFSYVVTSDNKDYIEQGLELAARYNAHFQYRFVAPIGRGKEFSLSLKEQISLYQRAIQYIWEKKYTHKNLSYAFAHSLSPKEHCGAMNEIITISPDGDVYMCPNLLYENFKIGDVNIEAKEIIKKHEQKSSDSQTKKLFYVEKCKRCIYKYFCGGECVANCIDEWGNTTEERDCNFRKILNYYAMFVKANNHKNDFEQLSKYLKYILENFEQIQTQKFFVEEIDVDYKL